MKPTSPAARLFTATGSGEKTPRLWTSKARLLENIMIFWPWRMLPSKMRKSTTTPW